MKLWFRRAEENNFPLKLVNNNAFVLKEWSAALVAAKENNTSRALMGWLGHCPAWRYLLRPPEDC